MSVNDSYGRPDPDPASDPTLDARLASFYEAYSREQAQQGRGTPKSPDEAAEHSVKSTAKYVAMFYKELRAYRLPKKLCFGAALTLLQSMLGPHQQG